MFTRYRTLLEQRVEEWEDGYGVVQIVTPEDSEENQLRFCYYKDGEFVNRPLTIFPRKDTAERTGEIMETMASLARTFTADEIEALVEELGRGEDPRTLGAHRGTRQEQAQRNSGGRYKKT